jgi:hypothetical protein
MPKYFWEIQLPRISVEISQNERGNFLENLQNQSMEMVQIFP